MKDVTQSFKALFYFGQPLLFVNIVVRTLEAEERKGSWIRRRIESISPTPRRIVITNLAAVLSYDMFPTDECCPSCLRTGSQEEEGWGGDYSWFLVP